MPVSADSRRVVADIGGTNTRIALFDPSGADFRALQSYTNRDFTGLEGILASWLEQLPEPAPADCCIAVAAPPSGDRVVMSNIDWSFSCGELAASFDFRRLRRLNDFEANAYALPYLAPDDRQVVHRGRENPGGRLATVGPGTGLGGAFLDWFSGIPHSFACEPGHMGLAPGNELELEIFRLLLPRHDNVYAELLVSGPGLARLYRALGEIRGEQAKPLEPAEISSRAVAGEDALCKLALETFCALLGSACGDFLLANGSYGGLYLAGGIVPRIRGFVDSSDFHRRFTAKGAMRDILAGVPVYVITTDYPGLIGAAHAPM